MDSFPLLQFDRRPVDRDLLTGFALTWTADLTLIQVMEDVQFQLNGYAIFRNTDVKKYRPIPRDNFWAKAARLHKLRPEMPAGVAITSMKEALASAGEAFPLVTIHRERIKRGVCYVGKLQRTSQRSVTLTHISTQGEWEEDASY